MKSLKSSLLLATAFVAAAANAHQIFYAGTFSGANEVPANGSAGTGRTLVTIDLDLITMRVQANFRNLTGNTSAAHIHFGAGPGTNGGVATMLPSFSGFPLGVTSGAMDQTYDMSLAASYNAAFVTANGGTVGGAFSAFLTRLGQGHGYFNIHSSTFPGGEVRANLEAVPEPGTMTALLAAAGVFALRRRK